MKFIWNEPPIDPASQEKNCLPWPKSWWEDVVWSWLRFNGVWPEENTYNVKHATLSYNYCHHFYDIELYECWLPNTGNNKREAIDKMYEYLRASDLDWHDDTSTWIWEHPKGKPAVMRPGVRFWIQAEDFPQERKFEHSPDSNANVVKARPKGKKIK